MNRFNFFVALKKLKQPNSKALTLIKIQLTNKQNNSTLEYSSLKPHPLRNTAGIRPSESSTCPSSDTSHRIQNYSRNKRQETNITLRWKQHTIKVERGKTAIYQPKNEEELTAGEVWSERRFAALLLVGTQVMFRGRESVCRGCAKRSAPRLFCDLLIYNTARSRHTVIKIKSYSGWSWGGENAQQGKFVMLGYWVWSFPHIHTS